MKMSLSTIVALSRRGVDRARRRFRPRKLRRALHEQSTEDFWRRRGKARSRGLWLVRGRYLLRAITEDAKDIFGIALDALRSLVKGLALGALVLIAALALESWIDGRLTRLALESWIGGRLTGLALIPTGDTKPPFDAFPTLAVQVSASLLGFYLASVSIVLGTSYHDVSGDVRALVLDDTRTRLHLKAVGVAIGAGLSLVLLQSFEVTYGYLTVGLYALLVLFSGYTFSQLALGAFNLFNPISLSGEPLRVLYRAINQINSKGLSGHEAVLRATVERANRSLRVLAELIDITCKRASVDRRGLATVIENLLALVNLYAQRKHLLTPTSAWFIQEPVYPRWIEASHHEVSIALKTSTPLQPKLEPKADWLERRSAELAAAALGSCIVANDQDAALRITAAVESAVRTLARSSHFEDAVTFARIVRDKCWSSQSENDGQFAIVEFPPFFLTEMLLGWREAIESWPDEIHSAVSATEWDNPNAKSVQIRGSSRVWAAAQRLLEEVRAEHDIEGQRVTPDWYLKLALADEAILSLREFAAQLPGLLDDFTMPAPQLPSSALKASTGQQALQSLAKADLVADEITQAVESLENLRMENEPQPSQEFEGLRMSIQDRRTSTLGLIAEAITKLTPRTSQSTPDLFGSAWFTLVHHTEDAIVTGDGALVSRVFPKILLATLKLEENVLSTYRPPTYEYNSAIFDPMIDILELSGLAMVYAALREDKSDDPIRKAWLAYFESRDQPETTAEWILNVLDAKDGSPSLGFSARDMARTEWERRLSDRIVGAGYARPRIIPFDDPPEWIAPTLIKMLGISENMPSAKVAPRSIFSAEVFGPLTGESEETLRKRTGLRNYYNSRDRYAVLDNSSEQSPRSGNEDGEELWR